ncbi:MAG: PQQ-like beta-propeller repeat protein [Planctomycetia bacterium]|nr:PQQ-like beta-propeller repeat protein [Planctomycetia bacterium]
MRWYFTLAAVISLVTVLQAADWPQWRGPERTGISQEKNLLQEWSKEGPPLAWKSTGLGTGYSSPTIANGRIYLQTTRDKVEYCIALNEQDGKQIWSTVIGKVGANQGPQYPGTRASVTVDTDRLYCLASDGEICCLSATDGSIKWQKHCRKDFEGKPGQWAYSESLLVDDDRVICTPGGESASMVALNKMTGEVIWKSAIPEIGTAEYSSIMAANLSGSRQYVTFLRKGIVGVDAVTGKLVWKYSKTVDMGANILTPIIHENKVFSSGSRTGGAVVEIVKQGENVNAKEVYFNNKLSPSIGGAVLVDGHLYGSNSQGVFCADFSTGEIKWSNRSVGASSVCYADGRVYLRGHTTGEMAIIEPNPQAYTEHGRFKQPERSKIQAWPHPVIANGCLYLRDQETLLCFRVAK